MRDFDNESASRFMFRLLIACAIAMVVFAPGCGLQLEARRTYEYRTVQHPDGRIEKFVKADILNSDMSLGVLKASGADGTTLEINDMTAEERVSAANQVLADGVNKLIDKVPSVPIP